MPEYDRMTTLDSIRKPVADELEALAAEVDRTFAADGSPVGGMMRYALEGRGKAVRPLVVLLSASANSCSVENRGRALMAAMLVEMIHVASLVHDDVIDESQMRRGRPSVNALWQSRNAVLAGDYMLARAVSAGLASGHYDIVRHVTDAIATLCDGEVMQNLHASDGEASRDDYFAIIRKKTAALIAASASAGAMAACAAPERVEAMNRYGEALGMAFQIRDDILDYTGGSENTGKPAMNDLREGKLTLPLIAVLERSDASRRAELTELLGLSRDDESAAERLRREVVRGGGIDEAVRVMEDYRRAAEQELATAGESPAAAALKELCSYACERER